MLDGHLDSFHIDLLQELYCSFEKAEKKKRPGLAHLKKTNDQCVWQKNDQPVIKYVDNVLF